MYSFLKAASEEVKLYANTSYKYPGLKVEDDIASHIKEKNATILIYFK